MTHLSTRTLRFFAPLVPYIAVWVGLFVLHSGWAALLIYHLGICSVLTLAQAWPAARNLVRGMNLPLLAFSILSSASAGIILYTLWPVLGAKIDLNSFLSSLGVGGSRWLVFGLYFILVNPWLEELYWRGALAKTDRRLHPLDLWYAGYHAIAFGGLIAWPWTVLAVAGLAGAAWFWRQMVRINKGLLIPALSHLAADAGVTLAVIALLRM